MNEKTIYLLIFLVSTALLIYVEKTGIGSKQNQDLEQNTPEYQESSDTYDATGDYTQPIQDENRPDILSY